MKKEIAMRYMRLKGGWIRVVDMEDDLGIDLRGTILSLKLEGMLDYEKRKGENYHYFKVWRLR